MAEHWERDLIRKELEEERWLNRRPVCSVCGEHIQDDYLYDFDEELVCDECIRDYVREHFGNSTERYIYD